MFTAGKDGRSLFSFEIFPNRLKVFNVVLSAAELSAARCLPLVGRGRLLAENAEASLAKRAEKHPRRENCYGRP
jgi:hypothetical protein